MNLPATLFLAGNDLLDLLFPRVCLGCGDSVESEEACLYVCDGCIDQIRWLQFPCCPKCGQPFHGELVGLRECPNCVHLKPSFHRGRVAFLLHGIGQSLVHHLKYRGVVGVLKDLPHLLLQVPDYLSFFEGAVLVPVPLHPYRFRRRGYNQAALIARTLAGFVKGASYADLLVRTRSTSTQTALPKEKRLKNVKNAFAPKPESVMDETLRYVVIDDVITTGATLESCCRVLRKAGASRVDVAALGRG